MAKRLNLGCGRFKKSGFVNLDSVADVEPDVLHDLNRFPYPFNDGVFSVVEADHVLEHLQDPFAVMKELYRICTSRGAIRIRVPHFSRGFTHPQHTRGFDVSFPLYFRPGFQGGYQGVALTCTRMRLRWFAQPYLKRTVLSAFQFYGGAAAGAVFDLLANLSPVLCSRLWCYWVGGFEEIEFEFRVEKPEPG